jgi:hypothetical protein
VFGRTPSPPFRDNTPILWFSELEQKMLRRIEGYLSTEGLFESNFDSTIVTVESSTDRPPTEELEKVDKEMETEGVRVMWMREPSHEHTCAAITSREEEENAECV